MLFIQRLFIALASVLLMTPGLRAQEAEQLAHKSPHFGFIENKGQMKDQGNNPNPAVKFLLPLPGNNVVLRSTGFSYDAYFTEGSNKNDARPSVQGDGPLRETRYNYHRVDVEFVGANPHAAITAAGRSTDYLNYYLDAGKEGIQVYHYSKVVYKDIYPGIDVEFISRPSEEKPVEYNFIVHPGADMRAIRLGYRGANTSTLINGKIELVLAHGKITECIPASYWERSKVPEDIRYEQISTSAQEIIVGFSAADNRNLLVGDEALVIDPTPAMEWATYYGGERSDIIYGVDTDASGNIYFAGSSNSLNAIATSGTHQSNFIGADGEEAMLVKMNASGMRLWGTYFGGDYASTSFDDVDLDPSGNIVAAGIGLDPAAAVPGVPTPAEALVAKFTNGGALLWSHYHGDGDGNTQGGIANSVATDASGNIFIGGRSNANGIPTPGAYQSSFGGGQDDAFIAKFSAGGVLQWSTFYGGTGFDVIYSVAVDASGNVYGTGATTSGSLASSGVHQTVNRGVQEAFLVKFNGSGARQWCTYYGGTDNDYANDISIDSFGNPIIAGETKSTSFIGVAPGSQTTYGGGWWDAFIAKFNSSGAIVWGSYYGGTLAESAKSIALDGSNNIYIVGSHFVKFNSSSAKQWETPFDPGANSSVSSMAVDANGKVIITGTVQSASAMLGTPGAHQTQYGGGVIDGFVVKFDPCTSGAWASASEISCDICAAPSSRCQASGTTQFTSTTANGIPSWTITDDNPAFSNTISATGLVTWDPSFSGTATITLTVTGCGPVVTKTKMITVTPPVSASELSCDICNAPSRCQSSGETQFTSTYAGSPLWTISSTSNLKDTHINQSGVVFWDGFFTGEATITLTVTGSCGTSPVVRTKTINVLPPVIAGDLTCDICSGTPPTRCQGAGFTQMSSMSISGTPTWSISDDNPEVSNTIHPSTGVITWNAAFTGQVTVTLSVTGCNAPQSKTKTITVTPTVSATPLTCDICAAPTPTRCQGAATQQFSSTIVGTPAWTITDDNPSVSNSISPTGLVTWDPAFSGQATVTLTVSGCGTPVTRTRTITVTPLPSATELSCNICGTTPSTRCVGEGTTAFTSTTSNGTTTWSITDDNPSVSNTISTSGVVTWNSTFTGQATITLNVTGCGTTVTRTKTIVVNPNVSATPLACDICDSGSRCEGSGSTQFTSEIGYANSTTWTISGSGNTISTQGLASWNSSFTGAATVTLTATGCGSPVIQSRTITVKNTYSTPSLNLTGPSFVCPGTEAEFNVAVSNASASPTIEFLIDDELMATGTATTFVVPEWNYENGTSVRCRIPNPNECLIGQGPEATQVFVYTQLDGVVDILPPEGEVDGRCYGPGTTQFTASVNITDYVWSISADMAGTTIDPTGLVTWDAAEIGYPVISLAAAACPAVQTSLPYQVQGPPPAPANQTVIGCNWEFITLKAQSPGNIINWYFDNTQVHSGNEFEAGDFPVAGVYHYFIEAESALGCKSETRGDVRLEITGFCDDDKLNWIETKTFDEDTEIYAHSKQYFDLTGKPLQSQTKLFSRPEGVKILASQNLRDRFNRQVSTTLAAPVQFNEFNFYYGFVLNAASAPYSDGDFDGAKTYNPDPVDGSVPGTLGWYYSANNTMEDNVPQTQYPYARTSYYEDGTAEVKHTAGAGDQHRLGSGHEILSGVFPVFTELNDYVSKRVTAITGTVQDAGLANEATQSVMRDANGKYTISIMDRSGKPVMTAMPGTAASNALTVTNTITSSGDPASVNYRAMTYFYILHDQAVSLSGSTNFVVENIVTGERKPTGQTFAGGDGKWAAGFYRLLLTSPSSQVTLSYVNYFQDIAYTFYDDSGRSRVAVSPNGYNAWRSGTAYAAIDKRTYQYNYQGWLLSLTAPDGGTTRCVYRKDGKIRFSQNAEQLANNRFSYTHYDKQGRPVESGEYTGTGITFVAMDDAGFAASLMKGELEKTADQIAWTPAEKKDWVRSGYDVAGPSIPHLPAVMKQEYPRGALSWTENQNNKTWYSYDEQGRVSWVAQKPVALNMTFVSQYTYDLQGNTLTTHTTSYINETALNPFYHHYDYDNDKRLSKVWTSTDGTTKKLRATYHYYLHGPLKRIELGEAMQGIDFVYNIQGWLTQINHPDRSQDPGGDTNDAFGMILDYYESEMGGLFPVSVEPMKAHDPLRFHKLPQLETAESALLVTQLSNMPRQFTPEDVQQMLQQARDKKSVDN